MEDAMKGLRVANYVWDTTTSAWVKSTQNVLITDSVYLAVDELEGLIAATNTTYLTNILDDTAAMVIDLAAIEVLLGTIDADTSALFGCVDGTELQVDVVSMPGGSYPDSSILATDASTTTPLNANSTWTSAAVDCSGFSAVTCTLSSDQSSTEGGMKFQFSTDGTNWDDSYDFHLDATISTTRRFQFPVCAQYFRINYTNAGTNQTYFRVQTWLHRTNVLTSIHSAGSTVVHDRSCQLMKSVITGETTAGGGGFVNVKVSASGALTVETEQSSTTWAVQDSTNEALLTSILADTASMDTSLISAVTLLGTIDADTGAIKTATEAIQAAVEIMDDWDLNDRCRVSPISGQDGVAANAGAVGATTQRVTLASDDPAVVALQIMDDWDESDRAKVNLIAGQAGIAAGAGAVGVTVPRVTLASDDPLLVETQDNKQDYFLGGWLVDGTDVYVGKEDKAGNYMIIKHATDTGVVTYEGGSGGLPASAGWSALSYQAYSTEF
jgi:hypothetical protein